MHRQLFVDIGRGVLVTAAFFVLLGLAYPVVESGIGKAFFSHQVDGSLTKNGSTRVGQEWKGAQWFRGRPDGFDPTATGASNLGPRSKTLVQTVRDRRAELEKAGITPTPGLVTSSGSGIDPDIAPADAYAQVRAVAKARGLRVADVNRLVASQVHGPELGFLGSAHVNVLQLNEALAELS